MIRVRDAGDGSYRLEGANGEDVDADLIDTKWDQSGSADTEPNEVSLLINNHFNERSV